MAFSLIGYIDKKYKLQDQQQERQKLSPNYLSTPEYGFTEDPPVAVQQPHLDQNNDLPNMQSNSLPNPKQDKSDINCTAVGIVVFLYCLPIFFIAWGVIHLNDCPAQNMIAVSFIIIGCLLGLSRIFSIPQDLGNIFNVQHETPKYLCLILLNFMVQIVIFGFCLATHYWILSINPDTNPEKQGSSNYCDKEFYKNAYYGSVLDLALGGILIFILCCGLCIGTFLCK